MTSLPFDPVRALDLSRDPPPNSLVCTGYLEPPDIFWGATTDTYRSNGAEVGYTLLLGVDMFGTGRVSVVTLSRSSWRNFIARLLLAGLPRPIAIMRGADRVCVLHPELFGVGFNSAKTDPKTIEYKKHAAQALTA